MIRTARTATLLALSACCLSCTPSGSLRLREDPQAKDDVRRILRYASLAGSSHNSQPWRVEVFGRDSLLVFADTTRFLPVVDHSGRELHISIGAFLENLRIAAASLSYAAQIDPLPGEASGPLARIRLVPTRAFARSSDPRTWSAGRPRASRSGRRRSGRRTSRRSCGSTGKACISSLRTRPKGG